MKYWSIAECNHNQFEHGRQIRWRKSACSQAQDHAAQIIVAEPVTDLGFKSSSSDTIAEQPVAEQCNAVTVTDSTADSWNRLRDKARVESELGLQETGRADVSLFDASNPGTRIAYGYKRIVYGDHGYHNLGVSVWMISAWSIFTCQDIIQINNSGTIWE